MLELNRIYNIDCIEGMKEIPDGSIDAIITDLPYGTTDCEWDSMIPLDALWCQYNRLIKKNGAIVLFGQEPFSSKLRLSNKDMYRYDWYWEKNSFANFAQAPYMPLKTVENVSVFSKATIAQNSKNRMVYNPQGVQECNIICKGKNASSFRPNREKQESFLRTKENYPKCELKFDKDTDSFHPTQKPVDLIRYLVMTYTNPGDTVLDSCMGSGTTAVACMKEKRNYIGFELNKEYYEKSLKRIQEESLQTSLF